MRRLEIEMNAYDLRLKLVEILAGKGWKTWVEERPSNNVIYPDMKDYIVCCEAPDEAVSYIWGDKVFPGRERFVRRLIENMTLERMRLIEAAPDLLKLLEEIYTEFKGTSTTCMWLERAEEAIARAKGEREGGENDE